MKTNKKLLEEKVNKEIEENNDIVNYYIAKFLKLPFPSIIILIGVPLLAFLSAQVSRVFFIALVAFIIYIIKTAITSWEYFIIAFLKDNIKLLQVEGDNLDVVNTQTYSYRDVLWVQTYANKNLYITFTDDKSKRYISTIKTTNSSFTLKEFDVKKFCDEKKQKE